MASTTSRLGLVKPATTENIDVTVLNSNADKIDALMGFQPVTSSTRPSAPFSGQPIRETDTGKLYVHDGSTPASAGWRQLPTTNANVELDSAVLVRWNGDTSLSRIGTNSLRVSGALTVAGALNASAGLVVTGNESVSGSAATVGNMTVGGNFDAAGTLSQGGKAVQLKNRLLSTQVSITPSAANVATSATITYPTMDGTVFRAQCTAQTTVPGNTVTGVGATSVGASAATIWVTRTNTTATIVNVLVIGSDS